MGNFNLNKNEEEGKKERFNLNKNSMTEPETEKKDRFSLNKGEEIPTNTPEKKDRFSLNKGQEAQNTSPEKKVNLSPNEGSKTSANALEEVAGHTADKSVAPIATASDFTKLKKEILADGKIDKEEVDRLRKELYSDGKIDEEEANFLFELNDAVSEKKNDPSWNQFFVTAISDYLLKDEKSPGVIDDEEGKWLVERIGFDGKVDGVEKQLLDNLKKNAKRMPKTVADLAAGKAVTHAAPASNLTKLKKEILADGKIDKDEVDRLRKELYSDGKIDEEEANFLFELNDAVSEKKNDPSWNQFFVTAISDYLLKDEKSPGVIDDEEGKWLVEKIGSDGKVDGVEKQLLDNLKKNAKKMPETVTALANKYLKTNNNNKKDVGKPKTYKWLWWLLIIFLIIALVVILTRSCKPSNNTSGGKPVTPTEQKKLNEQKELTQDSGNGVVENDSITQDSPVKQNESVGGGELINNDKKQVTISNPKPLPEKASGSATVKQNSNYNSEGKNGIPISQNTTDVQSSSPNLNDKSVEELAIAVIRGNYGNGIDRKRALGDRYREIQDRVNEIIRSKEF